MVDRISALPDDLLCHILSFLPTEFAVCTSILSTRWRTLHNLTSSIDVDIDLGGYLPETKSHILNYIERKLFCLSRKSIQKFCLEWHHFIDPLQINRWLDALLNHNIQELKLCINGVAERRPLDVLVPASLFSSETLVKLVIGENILSLKIPAEASLPNLKVLHIMKTTILSDQIEKLLSRCPVLDDLVLDRFLICDTFKLTISNTTLKRVTIGFLSHQVGQIVINSPAIEYLKIYPYNKESLVLLAKQSLSGVVLEGYSWKPIGNGPEHNVLKEINDIQSLHILEYTLRGICYRNFDLPLLNKLTYLKLCGSVFLFDARCLEYVLTLCVVLKNLVFEIHCGSRGTNPNRKKIEYSLQQSQLVGLLRHLKTIQFQLVKIGSDEGETLKKIFQFFLNNAEVLEELTVQVRDFRYMQKSEIMLELLAIPTVSKNCRVVVNEWRK